MAGNWTNAQILGQLESGQKWSGSTITYAFPTSAAGMYQGSTSLEASGFHAVSASQQSTFSLAIATWDDLIAPSFALTTSSSSNLEYAFTSNTAGGGYAYAYYPITGSAWFRSGSDVETASPGSYGFSTIMHETGHALGLNHMGNYDASQPSTIRPWSYQDSHVLSIMSYFGPDMDTSRSGEVAWADWVVGGRAYSPQTPMLNDVMAIQDIYGASTTTRLGDTVYGFHSNVTGATADLYNFQRNSAPILTLFDSGGSDTLDLSGWSTNAVIKLGAGEYSSANDMTNNIAIAYGSLIENGVGGGGNDQLYGNDAGNVLDGGSGNDTLFGLAGDDLLIGGAGNDYLDGETGTDTAVFSGNFSSFTIGYDAGTGKVTISSAGTGIDSVFNVERFSFNDGTRTFAQLFSTADTSAPTLVSRAPVDDATGVLPTANLVLSFNEAITAGAGSIRIYNGDGSVFRVISASDASQVSISGKTLTLNPGQDLQWSSNYYVNVDSNAVTDLAGNAFAGITGSAAYNFKTSVLQDTMAPLLIAFSPMDNSTGQPVGSNITLTFSEAVTAGSGEFLIYNANGTLARSIAVTDANQVSIVGSTVTINPSVDLAAGASYYVTVGSGVVKDLVGNAWTGLSGATTFNFSTAAPSVPDDYAWDTSTTGLVVVDGAGSAGAIETVDDADLFKVNLQAGQTYVFDLVSQATQGLDDPYLILYSPSVERVASDDDGGVSLNSSLTYTALTTGTFYLGAMDYSSGTGGYLLTATRVVQAADDFAANTSTTGLLAVTGQAQGRIDYSGDEDWFKVYLNAGTSYVFELRGYDGKGGTLGSDSAVPYLTLFDTQGYFEKSAYTGGQGSDPLMTFTPTVSGNYFLAASDLYDKGLGTYTLLANTSIDDYADNVTTTGRVAVGGQATGTIELASDADWFKVSLVAGRSYVFDLRGADGGGGTLGGGSGLSEAYLSLYDTRGYFLDSEADGGLGGDPRISFTPTVSGDYYLSAKELFGSGTGTYTIKATQSGFGRVASDFNGDGKSDLLWRNGASGEGAIWLGSSAANGQSVAAVSNLKWSVVGMGDFDGDGKSDLLWRNADTGEGTIWKSGSAATPMAVASVVNLNWKVVGVGDFDGDGKSDILWRSATSGEGTIWKGGSASTPMAVAAVVNLNWKVAGIGDFDGDGKSDILWRNSTTGEGTIWKSGSAATPMAVAAVVNLNWKVVGIGDFDGDGKSDLLWRNDLSGQATIWKGASAAAPMDVLSVSNLNWRIAAVGDYDGDGKSDLLWRNGTTGESTIWKGASASAGMDVLQVSNLNWKVVGGAVTQLGDNGVVMNAAGSQAGSDLLSFAALGEPSQQIGAHGGDDAAFASALPAPEGATALDADLEVAGWAGFLASDWVHVHGLDHSHAGHVAVDFLLS